MLNCCFNVYSGYRDTKLRNTLRVTGRQSGLFFLFQNTLCVMLFLYM